MQIKISALALIVDLALRASAHNGTDSFIIHRRKNNSSVDNCTFYFFGQIMKIVVPFGNHTSYYSTVALCTAKNSKPYLAHFFFKFNVEFFFYHALCFGYQRKQIACRTGAIVHKKVAMNIGNGKSAVFCAF